jgi:TRAP-type transport system periplasmic protein
MELKYGTFYPPESPFSLADQRWIERIEKETDGKVRIKPYWSGTLTSVRGNVQEVAKGIADIAFITPIYERSGFDLMKALIGFFWGSPSDKLNMKIYWELWDKFPDVRKEFESVKALALTGSTPMYFMSTKPVRTLADLKGMRIKTSFDMVAPLKEYGAEGLEWPMVEVYEGLKTGTLDGTFCALDGFKSYKFADVVKYETENFVATRGPNAARGMNWDTWNRLPPDIRKVLDANREWWGIELLNIMEKKDTGGRELAKKAGIQVIRMSSSDVREFQELHEAENVKTAKELDSRGLHATELYNETRRLLELYNGAQ